TAPPAAGAQQKPAPQTAAPPPQTAPQSAPPTAPPPVPAPVTAAPPAAPAAPMGVVTIPAGQIIIVRTIGMASTRSSRLGAPVSASLDAAVMAGSRVAIPRGAEATLVIASMDDGISLKLASITVGGRLYSVKADTYDSDSGAGGKSKKGVLGRVGGLVRKKHSEDGEAAMVTPGSRLTFTLQAPLEVSQ